MTSPTLSPFSKVAGPTNSIIHTIHFILFFFLFFFLCCLVVLHCKVWHLIPMITSSTYLPSNSSCSSSILPSPLRFLINPTKSWQISSFSFCWISIDPELSWAPAMVRELIAVVARAALQWALSSLLLANGAAFCLIAAAASWLRLGPPPCLLCAGVHRLLCSASAAAGADDARGQERVAFRRLLCDAHVAAIAAASEPEKKQQQQDQQKMISASDGAEAENSDKPGGSRSMNILPIFQFEITCSVKLQNNRVMRVGLEKNLLNSVRFRSLLTQ